MSKVKVNITVSLDGFVAGPKQSEKDPLGIGGEQLHEWLLPLKAFREAHGEEGGEFNSSTPITEEILGNVGTTIMGRGHVRWRAGAVAGRVERLLGRRSPTTTRSSF
jgi:hypothetical protein